MQHIVYKSIPRKGYLLSTVAFILIIGISISCKKGWLDAKPLKSLAVPTTIRDYQALLSNTVGTDPGFNDKYGMLVEHASGDFYVSAANFNLPTVQMAEKNAYTWEPNLYNGSFQYAEWNLPYKQIYYTNIVLEGIEKVISRNNGEQIEWNHIKGTALFFRAFAHYDIARQFCKPYVKGTASLDLGIPLRVESDFNEISVRSTVQQTYDQIISDLKESVTFLPISTPINDKYKCQPNKAAVYAMLARVYLAMSDYENAFLYSDKSLQLYSVLFNYNNLTASQLASTSGTFPKFISEMLFYKRGTGWNLTITSRLIPDSNLYKMFNTGDIRQKAFFTSNGARFKGSYDGTSNEKFTGLATDEVYLIRAECHSRFGRKTEALNDLNKLLINRWNGSFTYVDAIDANDALRKILVERRKELCFRSLRWEDLRRLNQDPQFAVTLTKIVNNQTFTLSPNSNLYVLPIPDNVIQLTGMQQNPRY